MIISRAVRRDATRYVIACILIALFLWLSSWLPVATGEPDLAAFFFRAAMVLTAFIITHMIRRFMWPGLDYTGLIRAAMPHPVGAGLAVIGVSAVICVMLLVSVPQ